MPRDEAIYLIPYFVSLSLSLGVLAYAWIRRSAQGATAFAAYAFGQSLWIMGFILELIDRDLSSKIFWDGFQWFAGIINLIALPIFAVQYTEYKLKNTKFLFYFSLIVPALFSIALFTDQYFHLIYSNPRLNSGAPFTELLSDFTPIVYIYSFYGYAVMIWGLAILFQRVVRTHGLYRVQSGLIALGFFIPIAGSIITLLQIQVAPQREITPFSAALGNLIIVWTMFRFRIFEVVPIARDRVFEAMVEPVVILDNRNIIVDINYSMLSLLGKTADEVIGRSAKIVFENFPIPIKLYTDVSYGRAEAIYELGGLTIHYELMIWPLYNANKEMTGRIYISHDITALKELEKELRKLNAELEDRVRSRTWELEDAYDTTLEGWARALELRDKETEGHSRRVTETTLKIAIAMGIDGDYLEHIRRGALLHDIGKMGISDEILHKSGNLTEEERKIINQHPDTAYKLLSPIPFLEQALEIPYCHHEKWDGTGYPRGLKAHAIPMSARIFAVADVWDAISSDRSYNKSWPKDKAIAYFIEQSGKHFDPRVVNLFLELVEKGEIE